MLQVREKVFKNILRKKFNSLVGKSCKRLEILKDRKDISAEVKISLLKNLIKELDYETMRDIEESVIAFHEGTHVDVKFTKPDSLK